MHSDHLSWSVVLHTFVLQAISKTRNTVIESVKRCSHVHSDTVTEGALVCKEVCPRFCIRKRRDSDRLCFSVGFVSLSKSVAHPTANPGREYTL
jgi:5,10-methylene-tetrahydrofolate dehydrogenase/methenyl tetrahydrofolate cyclohydrolase